MLVKGGPDDPRYTIAMRRPRGGCSWILIAIRMCKYIRTPLPTAAYIDIIGTWEDVVKIYQIILYLDLFRFLSKFPQILIEINHFAMNCTIHFLLLGDTIYTHGDDEIILYLNSLRPSDAYMLGKLTIIGSDNGLSPERCQAIIRTNDGILLTGPLGTNFNEILIEIQAFSLTKIRLKMSSAKCCSFRLDLNVLKWYDIWKIQGYRDNVYRKPYTFISIQCVISYHLKSKFCKLHHENDLLIKSFR